MFRNSIFKCVKLIGVDAKCRCMAAIVTCNNGFNLLVENVYLPCFESGLD